MITISELLLTFLLNAFWQILLITIAAGICARLLRGLSARYTYIVWVAALVLSIFLPVLTASIPLREVFFNRQSPPTDRQLPAREINLPLANPLDAAKPAAEAASLTIPLGMNLAIGF